MAQDSEAYPECGSRNSMRITCGMPGYGLLQEAEAGKVKLGGCVITDDPEYFCRDCNNEWRSIEATDEDYERIRVIKAHVGGYPSGYYSVDMDLANLRVNWRFDRSGIEEPHSKSIRAKTARGFTEQLKSINLLGWEAEYVLFGVCDGTQWGIEIYLDGRTIIKHGNNDFPREWNQFCKLLSDITRRRFR